MDNNLLIKRLKELRKMYSYTQDYVASALGIVRQTYSHYETGKRMPNPEILIKLAGLYHISVDDLLMLTTDIDRSVYFDVPNSTPSSEAVDEMIQFFNSPSAAKKYQYFSIREKELSYYFQKLSDEDKTELIEIAKLKANRKK